MSRPPAICQQAPLPTRSRPICIVGAGGIVRDAHLPAYALAGFQVAAIYDLDPTRSAALAADAGLPMVCHSLDELVRSAPDNAVFDIAIPASAVLEVLEQMPRGSAVLIQKPLGDNLAHAESLVAACRQRQLMAAVNFQLRFAPCILAARSLIDQGAIGDVHDMEVRVTVNTPWQLWSFMNGCPRVEILYHSVHYIDLIRSFLGNPQSVQACTVKHPRTSHLASTRSNIILDYGDMVRANITVNHGHDFGRLHQESYVKWEGTTGAIKATLGLLMNYPVGEPDQLQYCLTANDIPSPWQSVALDGNWFPHAFIGSMASLMRYANHETDQLPTHVDDACQTMAVVDAAYESSARRGIIPRYESRQNA